jgi:hypothetical protein
MDGAQGKLGFERWWWLALPLLGIPPALVLVASSMLLSSLGQPFQPLARPVILNGHAEAAARVTVLAMSVGLTAIGLACIGYFLVHLRLFRKRALWALAGLALATGGYSAHLVSQGFPEEAQQLLGESMVRVSLRSVDPDCKLRGSRPLSTYREGPLAKDCSESRYEELRKINNFQRLLLSFVSAALVFGTIACLAAPPIPTRTAAREQMGRLNTYLYLSAAALVTGLLFLSALLKWPGFAVHKDVLDSYNQHVGALVLFWGVTYSAFIAAYYVPVVLGLSYRWRAVTNDSDEDTGLLPPLGLLKAGAAIFSPAITALIGAVIAT